MMRTAFKLGYWVIEWTDEFDPNLADFVPQFPEIVQGHRVAIAAYDSGPFVPVQTQYDMGWIKKNGLAVSPPL